MKGFGPRLRAAREALGHRASEFADLLGVSRSRLANWEAGTHPPEPYVLAQLKQQFGIGADWVLSGDITALSGRVLKGLVNQGAAPDASDVAREVRTTLPDLPDPDAPPARNRLHERPAPPPGRFIRPPDVQQD